MVIINKLHIDSLAEKIIIDIATTSGNVFTGIKFWTVTTFQNATTAIDLSASLAKTSEKEVLAIEASKVNLSKLSGLFFIEFTTNETTTATACCGDINKRLAVVANFTKYHECILNQLLSTEVNGCEISEAMQKAIALQTYLEGLHIAIQKGFYNEAIEIVKLLDQDCSICHSCPDYGNSVLVSGGGFGIFNNSLALL